MKKKKKKKKKEEKKLPTGNCLNSIAFPLLQWKLRND